MEELRNRDITGWLAIHNKKKANSYEIAKQFEREIDKGGKGCHVRGLRFLIDEDEITRIMKEDGYNISMTKHYDD